jgi:HEAT repeat protein
LGKDLLRSWVQVARVVVTCRVNVWEADKNAFSGFDVFRNLQFNSEQVTEYIRRWFAGMGDAATGESLEAELADSENSRLKELIQNPLRLWMLCQIWDSRQGTLPDTQAKLYASFIKYIYRWKEQFIKTYAKLCGKTQSECQKLLHEALGELAKAAIDGKSGRFRLSYRLVSEYLGERSDETSLLSLALSLGWLNRVGIDFDEPEESVYAFYHATFQEYFAALAVDDWDYFLPRNHVDFPVVGKEYRIFEAQWKQVILLWLGLEGVNRKQKEEFIEALIGFEGGCNDFYEYQAYFLAAAGIAEFKDCSRADEIVRQVVKWGFGYFNEDKKEWLTFLKFIEEGARQALLQTDHKRATQQLCHILEHPQCPEETRMELADSLGTINSGNPQAVAALVKIIETTDDKIICTQAAQHLKKIGKGNPQAIADLIGLIGTIETIESEYNRTIESEYNRIHTVIRVADCLAEIGKGNPQAIAGLIGVIETTEYEFTCMLAADCLAKIGKGNPQAIAGLIGVIETTESEYTREVSNNILRKIANQEIKSENQEDIDSLIENLQQTRDKLTYYRTGAYETPTPGLSVVYEADCWMAAYKLSKLAKDNPKAINNLMYFLHNYNYWTRKQELFFSNKIQENQNSITEFMKFFEDIADRIKSFPCQTILNINILNYENLPERINSLLQIIYDFTLNDVSIVMAAINLLHEIIIKFPTQKERIINHLLLIIGNTNNEDECLKAAFALCKIDLNNQAITKFMELIRTSQDLSGYGIITKSVGFLKEVATQKQMPKIINSLKCCLSDEVRIREFKRFDACFDIIWHCAQNLPYPDFYRAWHGLTETQTSSLVQTLNLAQLPQFLQTQLAEINLAQTFQLLCIDTSKFIDSHNPALEIYEQFLDQNSPQRPNGEPETLSQLKSYWNRLRRDSDKHPILIFYQDPASPAAQGLSPTFLDALTRFDGTICLITDSPHPPLQTFSPHDRDLLQSVVNWLKRVHFES